MGITRQEYLYCLNDKSWQKIILIEINIKIRYFWLHAHWNHPWLMINPSFLHPCVLQSLEAEKLAPIAKQKERAQEALTKAQLENEEFSRQTKAKLRRSMEVNKENRDAQIQALQTRLRDHVSNDIQLAVKCQARATATYLCVHSICCCWNT